MNQALKIFVALALAVAVHSAVTVEAITGVSDNNLVFSGTIPISDSDSLFFTYYGVDGETNQDNLKKSPLLVVVGNPGTSAQYYSLAGIGPLNLQNNMTLAPNPNRFTASANLMFLDLLGSGFSFASNSSSLPSEAKLFAAQLSTALNTFAKESVLGQSSSLIVAGESTFIRTLPGLDDVAALKGMIHLSAWPELYAIGRYYGIAGLELKLYGSAERIAIDSTFTSCYNDIRASKFEQAHQCLDAIYNFVESKTKNANLFDVRLGSNLTNFLPMVQYYFSQSSVVAHWKAPSARLFESQSAYIYNLTYADMAKNYTAPLSTFMRDFYSIRHWFIQGQQDYISYYKGARNWLETQLNFVESDAFRKASLEDITVEGKVVGYSKAVKQVAYSELIDAGHHLFQDSASVLAPLFKSWVESLTALPAKNISTE